MAISIFAGRYNANLFNYGGSNKSAPADPPQVVQGAPAGTVAIQVSSNQCVTSDSNVFAPFATNAPLTIGVGASAETVTPTAVGVASDTGFAPIDTAISLTATFANAHGPQEMISSGTFGLQEAINAASGAGGGEVVIDQAWYGLGGTTTIVQAAIFPTNGSVSIEDLANGVTWSLGATSTTVTAAPSALIAATIASSTTVAGTWTGGTLHAVITAVNALGGETLASADYSFTAVVSKSVAGTGLAVATDIVGYRVYLGVVAAGATCYLAPVVAANGTVIQCGPISAFKAGTAFSIATPTVNSAAVIPVQSSAFGGIKPVSYSSDNMAQSYQTISGPFAVTGVVTAGTATELAHIQIPVGDLNQVYKSKRISFDAYYTPVSTATLILTLEYHSIYGATKTTLWTVTTPASSGTTAAVINGIIQLSTATAGATGTVEVHGFITYGGATGTAGLLVSAGDSVITVSGACDLTAQGVFVLTVNSGTANLTQSQLRRLRIESLE